MHNCTTSPVRSTLLMLCKSKFTEKIKYISFRCLNFRRNFRIFVKISSRAYFCSHRFVIDYDENKFSAVKRCAVVVVHVNFSASLHMRMGPLTAQNFDRKLGLTREISKQVSWFVERILHALDTAPKRFACHLLRAFLHGCQSDWYIAREYIRRHKAMALIEITTGWTVIVVDCRVLLLFSFRERRTAVVLVCRRKVARHRRGLDTEIHGHRGRSRRQH